MWESELSAKCRTKLAGQRTNSSGKPTREERRKDGSESIKWSSPSLCRMLSDYKHRGVLLSADREQRLAVTERKRRRRCQTHAICLRPPCLHVFILSEPCSVPRPQAPFPSLSVPILGTRSAASTLIQANQNTCRSAATKHVMFDCCWSRILLYRCVPSARLHKQHRVCISC